MADSAANQRTGHQPFMATLLRYRTVSYKLGIFSLTGAFALFVLGFSTSSWISVHRREKLSESQSFFDYEWSTEINWGLWDAPCQRVQNACNTALTIARVIFCAHLAGYCACLAVAAFENFRRVDVHSYFSRKLELCVLGTGVVGTSGVVIFTAWYSTTFFNSGFLWSLAVTSLSLTSLFVTFFLLLCGNRRNITPGGIVLSTQPTANYVYYQPAPAYGTSVVQTYGPGQPAPPVQYGPQTQPLLPPQPYPYPMASQPREAPPAYSLPPAYTATSMPAPGATAGPSYPYQQPPQAQYEKDSYAMASAPPTEDDTLPRKN